MSQGAKKTHQGRSRKTRDKLLNALEKLLIDNDFADISVSQIASEAGVSTASVYRRFDKKQGFIPVLFELYLERLNQWVASPEAQLNIEGCSLRQALKLLSKTAWRQMEQQTHILRAIYLHGRGHLALMGSAGDQFEAAMLNAMVMIIELYSDDIKKTDHDKAARMLAYYFNTILLERGLFKERSADWAKEISDHDFTEEIADFAFGYLQVKD